MANSQPLAHWHSGVEAAGQAERVELLYTLSRSTLGANLAAALLVTVWLWGVADRTRLFIWTAAMAVYLATGLGLYLRYQAAAPRQRAAAPWERRFAIKTAIGGLTWGMLVWLLLPSSGEAHRLFLILTLCTVNLAATAVLAPSRLAYYAFILPAVVPAAFAMLLGTFDGLAAARWASLIYLAVLISVHDLLYRSLCTSLTRRFQSEALAMEQNVIFDSAAEAIGLIRPHYLAKCNRQWGELFGCSVDEAIGKPAWSWFPGYEDWNRLAKDCLPAIKLGQAYKAAVQLRRASGELFWAEIRGMAVDPSNLDLGVVWTGIDISERLRTEAALRLSEQRFRDLISLSSDWYWETDRDFRITTVSGPAVAYAGHPAQAILGKRRWEIEFIRGVTPEQWRAHRETLETHLPFRDFTYQILTAEGTLRWFSISGNPAYDGNGDFDGYHGVGTDITERVRAAEQFRHLAHHDTLTGLPNRRMLADRLEQALALARRTGHHVSLLLLDLDDFKLINDALGHSAGDGALCTIAQRLRGTVREADTVARLGGDEFVILLPEMAETGDASRVAEKVIAAVRAPVAVGEREFVLGASIGIAVFPDHAANAEGLLQRADIAMYEAKRMGGSGFRFACAPAAREAEGSPPTRAAGGAPEEEPRR